MPSRVPKNRRLELPEDDAADAEQRPDVVASLRKLQREKEERARKRQEARKIPAFLLPTNMWHTPPDWVTRIRRALGGRIAVDPCAAPRHDHVAAELRIVAPSGDGLTDPWNPDAAEEWTAFANPPYSDLGRWAKRMIDQSASVARLLALVPLRPSSRWWRALAAHSDFIGVPRRRISYINGLTGRPETTGRADMTFFGWRLVDRQALDVIELRIVEGVHCQLELTR